MDVTVDELLNTKLSNFKARYKAVLAPLLNCEQIQTFNDFTLNEMRMYLCHPFARVIVASLREAVADVKQREDTICTIAMALGMDVSGVAQCYNTLPLISDGANCASQTQLWQYVQFFLKYIEGTE